MEAEINDSDESFVTPDGAVIPFEGFSRRYAPEFSYFFQARYEQPVGGDWFVATAVNANGRSTQSDFDQTPFTDAVLTIPGNDFVNLRAELFNADGWRLAGDVRNLLNEEAILTSAAAALGSFGNQFSEPRSYRVTLEKRF